MMRFAPVVPIEVAQAMQEDEILGNYHLLLAHDVQARSKEYREVYHKISYPTIIMDNSVIELGEPVDAPVMVHAIESVYTDEGVYIVVLPDALMDGEATMERIRVAFNEWAKDIQKIFPSVQFMGVPQGKDVQEWVRCVEDLSHYEEITWLGIPRNFREKLTGTRIQAVQIAHMINPTWQMHLLGFSDDLHDDMTTCHLSSRFNYPVQGIDSAVPIRTAMRERMHISFSYSTHNPRGDWWENPGDYASTSHIVKANIKRINTWIKS